jgi:holo-[acyl-carrier protein] synthase
VFGLGFGPNTEYRIPNTEHPERSDVIDGIGIDIIEVERVARAIRNERFVARVFTAAEVAECRGRGCPEQRFAGRFAAKEAITKALGRSVGWQEVEILAGPRGEPIPVLSGGAAALLDGRRVRVTISHCHTHAVAQAVVIRE